MKTHFIFDMDGTITAVETLPLIGETFDLKSKIAEMTKSAVKGTVPYLENFIRRVNLLSKLPVDEIAELLEKTPFHEKILEFICRHKQQCSIATSNLDSWINRLSSRIPCDVFCSRASVENNIIKKLEFILKKEAVVREKQAKGFRVVFIGDGINDMEAMRLADVAIASGLTHQPAFGILSISDYLCYEESALCRLLERLC